ncbi:hypothetical protein [Methylopila turkensis]|uniref:CopL family metal-binding regulatory protein n=1 Tax=Methylopila turkensis TaxID=1437816 RepID=A0A9W6JNJ2_9HYPH|nr:hypothetical protein [Methylopila turkensis]GLK79100.1 hypothetical protein GCM10008174_08410 [Methylopila turkensis]
MSAIFRTIAAVVFAVFVAAAWASPSEAHAGHDAPAAAEQSRRLSSVENVSVGPSVESRAADVAVSTDPDCRGHGESGDTRCCSSVCHAAMSEELGVLTPLPIEVTAGPSLPEPTAHSGPTTHVKRPPRPLAVTVG